MWGILKTLYTFSVFRYVKNMKHTHHIAGLSEETMQAHVEGLREYVEALHVAMRDNAYTSHESVLFTPFDTRVLEGVRTLVAPFVEKVKKVLVVGIGGSDLGARAVYEALAVGEKERVELFFFETVDPRTLQKAQTLFSECVEASEVVLVVVSKSGTTSETLVNAEQIFTHFAKRFGKEQATKQTIVISDAQSPLFARAQEAGMMRISFPSVIGGRYSVFTAVGLVPLALAGFSVESFCKGAQDTLTKMFAEEMPHVVYDASFLYEAYKEGFVLHELFFFHPELETVGKWYRQLFAESLGKKNREGETIGFVPTVILGSTDLHSVGQAIFGGAKNRITTLVSAPNVWENTPPHTSDTPFTIPALVGKPAGKLMQAIYSGVRETYQDHNLPASEVVLSALNEENLGAFFVEHIAQVMLLGVLFGVNAFDQPDVEQYKEATKRMLA